MTRRASCGTPVNQAVAPRPRIATTWRASWAARPVCVCRGPTAPSLATNVTVRTRGTRPIFSAAFAPGRMLCPDARTASPVPTRTPTTSVTMATACSMCSVTRASTETWPASTQKRWLRQWFCWSGLKPKWCRSAVRLSIPTQTPAGLVATGTPGWNTMTPRIAGTHRQVLNRGGFSATPVRNLGRKLIIDAIQIDVY